MDGQAQKDESQEQVKEAQAQAENTAFVHDLLPVSKPVLEYAIGDIVWAKIIGSPLWPSIVCYDPTNKLYVKDSGKKIQELQFFHIIIIIIQVEFLCFKQVYIIRLICCIILSRII